MGSFGEPNLGKSELFASPFVTDHEQTAKLRSEPINSWAIKHLTTEPDFMISQSENALRLKPDSPVEALINYVRARQAKKISDSGGGQVAHYSEDAQKYVLSQLPSGVAIIQDRSEDHFRWPRKLDDYTDTTLEDSENKELVLASEIVDIIEPEKSRSGSWTVVLRDPVSAKARLPGLDTNPGRNAQNELARKAWSYNRIADPDRTELERQLYNPLLEQELGPGFQSAINQGDFVGIYTQGPGRSESMVKIIQRRPDEAPLNMRGESGIRLRSYETFGSKEEMGDWLKKQTFITF